MTSEKVGLDDLQNGQGWKGPPCFCGGLLEQEKAKAGAPIQKGLVVGPLP